MRAHSAFHGIVWNDTFTWTEWVIDPNCFLKNTVSIKLENQILFPWIRYLANDGFIFFFQSFEENKESCFKKRVEGLKFVYYVETPRSLMSVRGIQCRVSDGSARDSQLDVCFSFQSPACFLCPLRNTLSRHIYQQVKVKQKLKPKKK